ncbi:MAG: GNAT family N-acetyltransferase [Spirochaetales bacterium]|nr:GNAT family N-acetyltransferase [Spirochaetales bacterium]
MKDCWHLFRASEMASLREFLKRWEYRNVNLSRYFFTRKGLFKLLKTSVLYLCTPNEKLEALLLKGPYGLFLPIFSENYDFMDFGLPGDLYDFKTLMGAGNVIQSSEINFIGRIKESVNYRLMSQTRLIKDNEKDKEQLKRDGLTIRRATVADAQLLFPLQQAYELEEVIMDPATFSPLLCMENLRKQLKNEIIFLAEMYGVPIAKAGTNARGLYYAQLGGIYTIPAHRSKGFSQVLVQHLIKELNRLNLSTCLFVKPENTPAISVYKKCGMDDIGDFRISYLF